MVFENVKYAAKIRLLFIPIFILMIGGLATIYRLSVDSLTHEHSVRLERTAVLSNKALVATAQEMEKMVHLFQGNRTLNEYLYITTVLGADSSALRDLLKPLAESLSLDDVDLYDARGVRVLDLDTIPKEDPIEADLRTLIGRLPHGVMSGFLGSERSIKIAAAAPLFDGGRTIGYITVAKYIDRAYLEEQKRSSGNDIILMQDNAVRLSTIPVSEDQVRSVQARNKLILDRAKYSVEVRTIEGMNGSALGSVVIALSDEDLTRSTTRLLVLMSVLMAVAALLSYALSALFIKALVRPLNMIVRFTEKVAGGALNEELRVQGHDEIADLAGHLNAMRTQLLYDREALERYTSTLERTVDERTEQLSRVQHQLLQSQKMEAVGQLAGGMAHDFNNILTAIIGYAGILHRAMPKNDPHQAHVEQIALAGKRAANLTGSLLAFSRRQALNPSPLDLNDVVQHIEKMLTRLIGEDIDFRTDLAADPLTIMADRGQIEQVLVNLAANARDAMIGGGRLKIATGIARWNDECLIDKAPGTFGDYATLSVSDTGMGMDQALKEKIFEPFFTTKEVGKGTGLGLSMVYGIVQQHNGCIAVQTKKGSGSTFVLYFPVIQRDAEERSSDDAPDFMRGGSETILVGEDDPIVREIVKVNLEDAGYRVILASDGEDLVAKFQANRDAVHLVLLDVIMPKKNGRAAYEAIRAIAPGMRAIFMSGYTADIVRSKGTIEDDIDLLSKPFTLHDLLKKIRGSLDKQKKIA